MKGIAEAFGCDDRRLECIANFGGAIGVVPPMAKWGPLSSLLMVPGGRTSKRTQ